MSTHYSAQLAQFATELKLGDIPQSVIARTEDLFVDCLHRQLAVKVRSLWRSWRNLRSRWAQANKLLWQALLKSS